MENILHLAQKLHALSQRGEDGERTNAEQMLAKLMAKHGITIEDLQLVARIERRYKYESPTHRDLIMQLWGHVNSKAVGAVDKSRRLVAIDFTHAEHMEMVLKLDHYWQLHQREHGIFWEAFIRGNDLVRPARPDAEQSDLTPEDIARIRRVLGMSQMIAKETPLKRIGPPA